jgi:Rrf2 family protein
MLTQRARYALHAMLVLARAPEGVSLTVAEIAAARKIPPKYLEQVIAMLRLHNLVDGKRGRGGGYVLTRPASEISMAMILRAVEGPLALAPCASQTAYRPCADCESVETCEIRPVLMAVRDTTALLFEGTSLAEMTGKPGVSFL